MPDPQKWSHWQPAAFKVNEGFVFQMLKNINGWNGMTCVDIPEEISSSLDRERITRIPHEAFCLEARPCLELVVALVMLIVLVTVSLIVDLLSRTCSTYGLS